MPTGVYRRTPEQLKAMRENLALGRLPEARKKATAKIKKIASDPEWRRKLSEAVKKAMHRPEVRKKHLVGLKRALISYPLSERFNNVKGGKGREPTDISKQFREMLEPLGFVPEFTVKTKGHGTGLPRIPNYYHLDFAHDALKVAVELDGSIHQHADRKDRDERKTKVLEALGWTVWRIPHK